MTKQPGDEVTIKISSVATGINMSTEGGGMADSEYHMEDRYVFGPGAGMPGSSSSSSSSSGGSGGSSSGSSSSSDGGGGSSSSSSSSGSSSGSSSSSSDGGGSGGGGSATTVGSGTMQTGTARASTGAVFCNRFSYHEIRFVQVCRHVMTTYNDADAGL